MPNVTIIIRNVPDDLRRLYKTKCASEGISMADKMVELMRDWLRGEIKNQKDSQTIR